MNIKRFIDRPILSIMISGAILLVGIIGLATLPIEQYPDIAPPTVMVSATYTGANAESVQKSVIVPLEEEINGVENMTYMTSTATNSGSAEIQIFGLYSEDDTYDETFLNNYMKINIQPAILRIPGVSEIVTMGANYSMRIWLKPEVMAQYKLVPSDIETVLNEQNLEAATGSFGEVSAVGSLVQPIFNKGKNRANLKIAQAQQEEALLSFRQSLLNAGTEVSNAMYMYQSATDKSREREVQVDALESSVEYTNELFLHGTSTYLEVLTAQQDLFSAQLSQVNDRFEQLQATINLYHALGGGRNDEESISKEKSLQ